MFFLLSYEGDVYFMVHENMFTSWHENKYSFKIINNPVTLYLRIVNEWSHQSDWQRYAFRSSAVLPEIRTKEIIFESDAIEHWFGLYVYRYIISIVLGNILAYYF